MSSSAPLPRRHGLTLRCSVKRVVKQQHLHGGGDLLLSGGSLLLLKCREIILMPKIMVRIARETGLSREPV